MSSFRVRPRFSHTVPLDPEATRERIVGRIDLARHRCEVKNFPGYMCLRIPESERHFWSPRLTLGIEENGEGSTRIEGIYGPNANVWALFLYGYMITGTLGTFAGCIGTAQWMMGKHPWGLWVLALMVILAIALYITAQIGQKLGARQTFQLHDAYEASIGEIVEIH